MKGLIEDYKSFDPTYKGWKLSKYEAGKVVSGTLWSYLQGMETASPRKQPWEEPQGFDPTYKGWKPLTPGESQVVREGFDPTYKGWKLDEGELPDKLLQRFDPTYKGWKPNNGLFINVTDPALWSYLQGMETRKRHS